MLRFTIQTRLSVFQLWDSGTDSQVRIASMRSVRTRRSLSQLWDSGTDSQVRITIMKSVSTMEFGRSVRIPTMGFGYKLAGPYRNYGTDSQTHRSMSQLWEVLQLWDSDRSVRIATMEFGYGPADLYRNYGIANLNYGIRARNSLCRNYVGSHGIVSVATMWDRRSVSQLLDSGTE